MAAGTHLNVTTSSINTSSYTSTSFTPAAGDLLVVFVVASETAASGTMTDSQSLGFTKINSAAYTGNPNTCYVFVANATAAASSMTVTFDCTGDAATGCIILVCGYSGIVGTGSSAVVQSSKTENASAGTTPAATFSSSVLTGNPTLGLVGNQSNAAAQIPPTSWTEPAGGDTGYNNPTTGAEYCFRDSGFTGTTMTWGSTSSAHGVLILELNTSSPPVAVSQASETDTSQAVAWAPKARLVAESSEADTAQTITAVGIEPVLQASETDTAGTVTPLRAGLIAQASETDTAHTVTPAETHAVSQASETDTADTVTPRLAVAQATEYERAKQVAVVGGLMPVAEFPVLIRAPLRAGRIFHEIDFKGDTYHPNVAGFQAEETAPGGFGPATGRISERIFRRHRDIMRAGAHWTVWHEDGTCLHHGKLLEPDTSEGEIQLTDRGTSSLADRQVGPILYQAAIAEELGRFAATRQDGKDVVIPMFGRELAFLRCHVQGTKAELTVFTAQGVRDPSIFNSAEIDTSDLFENFYMTLAPTGDFDSAEIEVDLTAGSELLTFPNTTLLTNAGDEADTGTGYLFPEMIVFSVGDDTVLGGSPTTEVLISNIEINGVAVGERRRFSAHDLVADVSAVLGVKVMTLEGGSFDVLPYELPAGVPASEALDYASLVSGKMWRLRHNGQRAVMEFGVHDRWGLASPWSPFDAIPQELFDAVAVPFTYAGTQLNDQVIVRLEDSPLDRQNVFWGLALAEPAHNGDKARALGARVAEELIRKRNAGSFAAAELIDADGNKTTAHHCFAGDSIVPMRPHEPGRLRIGRLTRFEDHIEGDFDGELAVLDRMNARRAKRLPRLRYV